MSSPASRTSTPPGLPVADRHLLRLTVSIFVAFLSMGLAMPTLPLHLRDTLGATPFVVGLVVACQFIAALVSRAWCGHMADTRGARMAMHVGLGFGVASGALYLLSLLYVDVPWLSIGLLMAARACIGITESFAAVCSLAWGTGLIGPARAGKVMSWVGMAMFGAYMVGAPLGAYLYGQAGFLSVGIAALLLPMGALALLAGIPGVPVIAALRLPFARVVGLVTLPGLGLACAAVGFGSVSAFIALLFADNRWGDASLAFTAFGAAYIGARLLFGHLPDAIGGARVALAAVAVETVGMVVIWTMGGVHPVGVYVGAALTGFGFSLAFPGFGVEAVHRAPPANRGSAMGAYVAFLDVALAITGPLAGLVAGAFGLRSIYGFGAIVVAGGVAVAWVLARQARREPAAH
ncbi:MAG: arabinose transporter [Burkholderiaceae bacterium]|nr:arabinose transporter [Burkholderiaceae bacterium]